MEVQSSANVDYGSLAEVLVEQVIHQAEPPSVSHSMSERVSTQGLMHMPSELRHGACWGWKQLDARP